MALRKVAHFIEKRAGWVALFGTALAFLASYYAVQLFANLRTDFQELLPTHARSVVDLSKISHRLDSIDNLGVLVFSQHPIESERFVVDLAHKLAGYPKTTIASVEYKIDNELKFFKERQALYLDLSDLESIRDYIRDKIHYETALYNPLNIFSGESLPEPILDFLGIQKKYASKAGAYDKFPRGFYAIPNGTIREVLVYIPANSGISEINALKAVVNESIAALGPGNYAPDLSIKFTGGVQDTFEEHAALIADLLLSTVIVAVLVTLAMLVFYQSIPATLALVFSLFMGVFWTFGVCFYLVGYLNANSAFMGSIVIGNGINFGIIFLARYLEERRQGNLPGPALETSMVQTAPSTITAALAAGLSYGSLMLTSFRGFSQFGVIGLMGMILCWISSYTLLPAYLILLERIRPIVKVGSKPPRAFIANAVAHLISRFYRPIWIGALVLTLASVATFARYKSSILETDLTKLRNKESMINGSAYFSRFQDQIFQRYLAPLVILPNTREQSQQIAKALKELKAQQGPSSLIATVQSLDDFVPTDQGRKIEILRQIRDLLPERVMVRLSPEDRARVKEFLQPPAFHAFGEKDLPPLVLNKFTEKDGSIGKMVLVEPPLTNATWDGDNLKFFIRELREVADRYCPGAPVAGSAPLTSDMIEAVGRDGPRATLFAFLAVMILVIVIFRNFSTISLTLFSLVMGVTWLLGFILGFWFKINFLNFVALPITFGIGVDYGVNIFQRYREEGPGHILRVIRNTGGAVGLCSFTTIVGYSSLLIAGNQGFVSFGRIAVVGELTCVIAAVIALPSFLLSQHEKQKKGASSEEKAPL